MVPKVLPFGLHLVQLGVLGAPLIRPYVELRHDACRRHAQLIALLEQRRVGRADEKRLTYHRLADKMQPILDKIHHHGRAEGEVQRRAARLQRGERGLSMIVEGERAPIRQQP